MSMSLRKSWIAAVLLLASTSPLPLSAGSNAAQSNGNSKQSIKHVLLISIDGMHAVDFINCVNGISGANGGEPYCPNMAGLKPNGID